ncbi:hypothetical protein BCR43DRAFT_516789 [Syncephalastrum racemosum]|uniref:Extracellular membrane protein CFEM domain-containing protein n=1 Tax=Syncephalastrum racemosum TaxID=13706 RepID=A0A1X2H5M1_SYNRA|nr:hypothetical protein BCR43DRAFT_516789 [Syncephalastrum racemosum]
MRFLTLTFAAALATTSAFSATVSKKRSQEMGFYDTNCVQRCVEKGGDEVPCYKICSVNTEQEKVIYDSVEREILYPQKYDGMCRLKSVFQFCGDECIKVGECRSEDDGWHRDVCSCRYPPKLLHGVVPSCDDIDRCSWA